MSYLQRFSKAAPVKEDKLSFLHATLHALSACSRLTKIVDEIHEQAFEQAKCPTILAYYRFLSSSLKSAELLPLFCHLLSRNSLLKYDNKNQPREQDAQDFLGVLITEMDAEYLEFCGQSSSEDKGVSRTYYESGACELGRLFEVEQLLHTKKYGSGSISSATKIGSFGVALDIDQARNTGWKNGI